MPIGMYHISMGFISHIHKKKVWKGETRGTFFEEMGQGAILGAHHCLVASYSVLQI